MNKLMAGSIAIAMLLLAGCGAAGEGPPEPGPIASVEAIVGIWHRTSGEPWYIQFSEDGNMNTASTPENTEDRPRDTDKFWFEGGQLFLEMTSVSSTLCEANIVGIYEVHLLENGNIQFVAIEDECVPRATTLSGREGLTKEYEPVP